MTAQPTSIDVRIEDDGSVLLTSGLRMSLGQAAVL